MMDNKQKQGIPFRLLRITTEDFATFREHYDFKNVNVNLDLYVQIKANQKDQVIGLFTRFSFTQKESPILILESACHFEIDKTFWEQAEKGNDLVLPSHFATHLLVLAIGTARGIIHAKKPAWLENLVLNILDVSMIFGEEDIHIPLNENG